MSASPSTSLSVNVACLACDGSRPCADCRAAGRALAASGHRAHHSSRYAALRAAAEGTYGFPACVIPLRSGERSVADAIVALLADARVAIAADDAAALPEAMPANIVTFPRADFLAGALPRVFLEALSSQRDVGALDTIASRSSTVRSDATRRLRAAVLETVPASRDSSSLDARALLADEIAWFRASGIGFSALAVSFAGVDVASMASALRATLRGGDRVAPHDDACVIVLPGEPAEHAQRIARRAFAAARKRLGLNARAATRSACVACPDDSDDPAALLERLRI